MVAPPTWVTGQVLTASDVNNWFTPEVSYKTADTSRTSNTTMAADPELSCPVLANAFYRVEVYIDYEGGTEGASDLKWSFVLPSGTLRGHCVHEGVGGSGNCVETVTGSSVNSAGTKGAGTLCGLSVLGSFACGSTPGNIVFQWAQNTSSGTATTVHAQSTIMLVRIG